MSWQVLQGDVRERLAELEPESVQTVVTSPPYWGLRDYGTARWDGGSADCDHVESEIRIGKNLSESVHSTRGGAKKAKNVPGIPYRDVCGKCGAKRTDSQLGLEPTPEQYVENMVAVFREVRRVLRDDGTLWLNLGDSYAGSWGAQSRGENSQLADRSVSRHQILAHPKRVNTGSWVKDHATIKAKDLIGIPWRVAFALQADGWWLRSDIIWAKPNPMPESVTDRPTKSHEYLFLLAKSERYYYDAQAIREKPVALDPDHPSYRPNAVETAQNGGRVDGFEGKHGDRAFRAHSFGGRNKRSVWTVTTQPYPDAHFATFPPKLVEPCILAGSKSMNGIHSMDCVSQATVFDPFAGSGTTGLVALRHERSFVGIELNPDYCDLARNRIRDDAPLLNAQLEAA